MSANLAERFREHLDMKDVRGEKAVLYERDLDGFTGGEIMELQRINYLEQVEPRKWLTGDACDRKRLPQYAYVVRTIPVADEIPAGDGCIWTDEAGALEHARGQVEAWVRIAKAGEWVVVTNGMSRYVTQLTVTRKATRDLKALHGEVWLKVVVEKLPQYSDTEDYLRASQAC